MKLRFVDLEFRWSEEDSFRDLRGLIKSKLKEFGDPLRWAITASDHQIKDCSFRSLKVEAIVIVE